MERAYYLRNKNEILRKQKIRYQAKKEEILEKCRKYYQTHKEQRRESQRRYNKKNRERLRRYFARYREANRERLREYRREWTKTANGQKSWRKFYLKNRSGYLERASLHYRKNKETILQYVVDWQRRRRLDTIMMFGGECQACGYNERPHILEFDHVKPIKKERPKGRSFFEVRKRPALFQLLCPNCHLKKTVVELRKKEAGAVALKARIKRLNTVIKFGGKCGDCGFDDVNCLEFDHVIPRHKSGRRRTMRNDHEARLHPERFQLLCATCHRIKTERDAMVVA